MTTICTKCKKDFVTLLKKDGNTYKQCNKCRENKEKKCEVCTKTRPTYSINENCSASHCSQCKTENMINVSNKQKCIKCKNKTPYYRNINDKKATYCKDCKNLDMVNIRKRKKCIKCGETQPSLGFPSDKIPTYCGKCKLPGMINIKNKKCIVCQTIRPNFGYKTDKIPTHCSKCQLDNMIDLMHKKCVLCKKTQPIYGNPIDKVRTHCAKCRLPNQRDLIHPECIVCGKRPNFGLIKNKPTHCFNCKTEELQDVVNAQCKTNLCSTRPHKKYDGYCAYCYVNLFPDNPISINFKTKERAVADFIKEKFTDIDLVFDKKIQEGCSLKRPDVLIDLGYQIIIIEVDENMHNDYDESCENKRLMQLSQDVGHRPIIFIRFNPDSYTIQDTKVKSCWSLNKEGKCILNRNKKTEWKERLNTLYERMNYWVQPENKSEKMIEIEKLYYDIE